MSDNASYRLKSRLYQRQKHDLQYFIEGIKVGNRVVLSKAITLIESSLDSDKPMQQAVLSYCLPLSGKAKRIGITGVPGVGKSTFLDTLGAMLIAKGHKLAILAVDPSSEVTGGSILGDKTRMQQIATSPMAFIRPSPSSGNLGGVARKTREAIILCEAAGFDHIFVETVGVGQSETTVKALTDYFLLLLLARAGDELQGIKRGIMELADGFAINKADGEHKSDARITKAEIQSAIHLFPPMPSGQTQLVKLVSSLEKTGIEQLWSGIVDHFEAVNNNGYLDVNRRKQSLYWFNWELKQAIEAQFYASESVKENLPDIMQMVENETVTPFEGAEKLLQMMQNKN